MQYELLFLLGHDKETDLESIEKKIEGFVAEIGGEILPARWESKRHLAYPIKHQERGVYVARRFTLKKIDLWAEGAQEQAVDRITKLSQTLRLYNDILRFSLIRSEELEDLETFSNRKAEERKTHRQTIEKKDQETVRAKQRPISSQAPLHKTDSAPQSAPTTASVSHEAPKKEVSVAEINDKLDEILNS